MNESSKVFKDYYCKKCGRIYEHRSTALICTNCLVKLEPYTGNVPKCPTCNSTYVDKISGTRRAVSQLAFGILSPTARAQFICKNCGYKW